MTSSPAAVPSLRVSRIALLASLALNLFFIGIEGAAAVRKFQASPTGPDTRRTAAAMIDRIASTLPPDDAEKLRASFREREPQVEAVYGAYRQSHEAIKTALRTEPFDPEKLSAAMSATRTARQALEETMQGVIVPAATAMSEDGRAKLADRRSGSGSSAEAKQ